MLSREQVQSFTEHPVWKNLVLPYFLSLRNAYLHDLIYATEPQKICFLQAAIQAIDGLLGEIQALLSTGEEAPSAR